MAPTSLISVATMLACMVTKVTGSMMISASPSSTVATGSAVQVVCYINTETDIPDRGRCVVTWSRNYYPGRDYRAESLGGKTLDQPRFFTTTDSSGQPLSSTVHIAQMKEGYRGTYTCKLTCDGFEDSASIVIDILSVPVTFGATIGTLVAFLVVSIILLLAFFIGCRHCCCRGAQRTSHILATPGNYNSRIQSNGSAESLLREQRQNEADMAPPRYSVVVSLPRDGSSGVDTTLTAQNNTNLLTLQPPSYEDALKDLASKGIIINCSELKPMPPAYSDIPFTVPSSDSPAILQLDGLPAAGSPA